MTRPSAASAANLDLRDLEPLASLLTGPDDQVRAAAAETAARLPLRTSEWEHVADVLTDLLDARDEVLPLLDLARAAAHAPLLTLRRRLRTVAQDGTHPGHHAAAIALSEVGDDTVLSLDVERLLSRPITGDSARRLAALPLERLRPAPGDIPVARPHSYDEAVQSWWLAVAAARLGDTDRLDRWLSRVRDDPAELPAVVLASLRAVLPLADGLLAHLRHGLAPGSPRHDLLRSAWLTAGSAPAAPERLDDFAAPLARFVTTVRDGSVLVAGLRLSTDAAALPSGTAPDPRPVFETWRAVPSSASSARSHVAWVLGRAGASVLVDRLSPWLGDSGSAVPACLMIRDAAAWLATPEPPGVPPGVPPWPRPTVLAEPVAASTPPLDWADAGTPFDVDVGSDGNAEPGSAPTPTPGYARMSCPSAVVEQREFELEIGIADRPTPGVTAQPLALPEPIDYTLTVQVVVDGFRLRPDEQATVQLRVGSTTPYPATTLHLTALADARLGRVRAILAVFSVDGRPVGSATRAVEVVASSGDLPVEAARVPATGVDTTGPADAQPADLTITIGLGDDIEGRRLLWSYQSPHQEVPTLVDPLVCDLGSRPDEFARSLMRTAGRAQGESLERLITGKAQRISRVVPTQVHAALHAVAAAVDGPPSVMLVSAEPYVPWELSYIEPPWLPDAPAFLGAQARVGRWALRRPGPTSDPPREVLMRTMTVVRGVYEDSFVGRRLEHAEKEAEDLRTSYGAAVVDAAETPFFACLDGEPPADVLHFAMHGKFDPGGLQDGLILVDGAVVEPDMILGTDLSQHPFVFLNACQVGQAGETLGQYGGMAQAFVEAGAAAVVAPLWVVQDDVARDVSLRFYAATFAGMSPGEFLRAERARDSSGTHLAYVLYAHPLMHLTWLDKERHDADTTGS